MLFHDVKITVTFFVMSVTAIVGAEAAPAGHLVPVGPNFDTRPPFGSLYAKVCERMLFTGSKWMIRYHGATESVTTALSISEKESKGFRVTVKQAKPQLGSVVANSFWQKSNLGTALAAVKIKEASAEIPGSTARTIHALWLSLLARVGPDREPEEWNIAADQVILYGKSAGGKVIAGKFPRNSDKYSNLMAIESIVDDLIRICVEPEKNHTELFNRIERRASGLK